MENTDRVAGCAMELTGHSLGEKGCVAYDIFVSKTRPGVMMICETWADQESLDAHSSTDVFKRCVGEMRSMAEMKLERFEF